MVKHRTLILTTDPAEIAQEAATVSHHSRESDLLLQERRYKKKKQFKIVFYLITYLLFKARAIFTQNTVLKGKR